MKTILLVLALTISASCYLVADEEGPGHDAHHHEELTEAQLGTVHFPTSCSAAMQKPVERGVAMLHSFWYEEAEKEFEQIEKNDPQCAIAHWGLAMRRCGGRGAVWWCICWRSCSAVGNN